MSDYAQRLIQELTEMSRIGEISAPVLKTAIKVVERETAQWEQTAITHAEATDLAVALAKCEPTI
jgi:hypothetical protein